MCFITKPKEHWLFCSKDITFAGHTSLPTLLNAMLTLIIGSKNPRRTLHLSRTGTRAIVLGSACRCHIRRLRLIMSLKTQNLGTNQRSILTARFVKQLLHHTIARRLASTVGSVNLSAVESNEHHYARHGTTHHAQSPHSTTKAGANALCHIVVHAIKIGKGCHYRLAAAISMHEIINSPLYPSLKLG